jgi:uncharacterized protein YceH (UPF0502 family)
MEIDRTERRILGSLIEKRWSTPDQYPLSINALVAACNQRNNRDPVIGLQEFEVTGALMALREKGLVLIREREGGRVPRYAERLTEELGLTERASALLAELLLRGPQSAPELLRRIGRMVPTESQDPVDQALAELSALHVVRLLPRESGRHYARFAHTLAPAEEDPVVTTGEPRAVDAAPRASAVRPPASPEPGAAATLAREMEELRQEVAELRARVAEIERLFGKGGTHTTSPSDRELAPDGGTGPTADGS